MPKYEQKPNSGALFKNKKQREGKQDPIYTGSAVIGGVEYWVNAWLNTAKGSGEVYMGLKFAPKDDADTDPVADIDPDDIPF